MTDEIKNYTSRADVLDNGQGHLAVNISELGFAAWLVPDPSLGRSPKIIVKESWQSSSGDLLHRIEDAVYDNPTILDDYSADIIIESNRQLWLPAPDYPTDEDCADAYTDVYGADPTDIFVNDHDNEKNVFSLVAGLRSFLQRSLPGARIWSQLSLLRIAAIQPHEAFKCLVDVRDNFSDFILLDRGQLLCASSHPWKSNNDIAYTLLSILSTFDADSALTDLVFSGNREIRHSLGSLLLPQFKSISQKNHDLDGNEIPTAVSLAINRKRYYANHKR